jgi:hypothetical protein
VVETGVGDTAGSEGAGTSSHDLKRGQRPILPPPKQLTRICKAPPGVRKKTGEGAAGIGRRRGGAKLWQWNEAEEEEGEARDWVSETECE